MSDSEDDCNDKQLKIVVLGEQNVGKTCLIRKLCYDEFSRVYIPTIGADFYIKRFNISGNKEVIARITDVSGMELNGHMLGTYLFKVDMIILVYDITSYESFDLLIMWLRNINKIMENNDARKSISIAVLGNKCDMEHKRAIRIDVTNRFVHDNKLSNYFVSAKTGENINSSFIELIARYLNLPLSNLEKDKQKSIIKAELTPNTPPAVKNRPERAVRVRRNKEKQLKKDNTKITTKQHGNQSCVIQ